MHPLSFLFLIGWAAGVMMVDTVRHYYRTVESLVEYVLIAQDSYHVEHYVRQSDGQWLFSEATGLAQTIHLPTINRDLPLADVYDKVEIEEVNTLWHGRLNGSNGLQSSRG